MSFYQRNRLIEGSSLPSDGRPSLEALVRTYLSNGDVNPLADRIAELDDFDTEEARQVRVRLLWALVKEALMAALDIRPATPVLRCQASLGRYCSMRGKWSYLTSHRVGCKRHVEKLREEAVRVELNAAAVKVGMPFKTWYSSTTSAATEAQVRQAAANLGVELPEAEA